MNLSDQEVFTLTKTIYKQMKVQLEANIINAETLPIFNKNYVEPLYPYKPSTSLQNCKDNNNDHNCNQSQPEQQPEQEKSQISRYKCKQLCCDLGVGNFFCWKSYKPDPVYEDLGLSTCLYLKFMKHLVLVLLVVLVLPFVIMAIYNSVANSNNINPSANYQKTLFSFTLATLELEGIRCKIANVTAPTTNFILACPVGNVRILGPVYTTSTYQIIKNCKTDILNFKTKANTYVKPSQYTHVTTCNNMTNNCTYNLTLTAPNPDFQRLSVTFECINGQNTFGSTPIARNQALYVAVAFDLIIVAALVLFYWSQSSAEDKQEEYFKSRQLLLNSFSLAVGNFSKNNFDSQFRHFLQFLNKQIDQKFPQNIVQVRLPDNQQELKHQKKRKQAYEKIYAFFGRYFLDKEYDPNSYKDAQQFKTCRFDSLKKYGQYKKKFQKNFEKYTKAQALTGKNQQQELKIYILFQKPLYKRLILQKTQVEHLKTYLQVQDKKYLIQDPPNPALIIWTNMKKNKLVRGLISWTITILILVASYVLIAFILSERTKTMSKYNFNIDCAVVFPEEKYDSFDSSKNSTSSAYLTCYCLSKTILITINTDPNCKDWAKQYTVYILIPIFFSIGLAVANIVVSLIYRLLSKFQGHSYMSSQLYSYIIKKTTLQILFLALIVIVLSIDQNTTSKQFYFLFQGTYKDVTADWYEDIGVIFTLTILINSILPFVEPIVYIILQIIRKIKIFFFNRKNISQKTKENYMGFFRGDVFPIQERYASILAILFICLSLNCAFPIFNILLFLTLLFYGLVDKILIIKVYHKPINYEVLLHKKVMNVVLFIILFHLVITAIFLTQPFMLVAGDSSHEASILNVQSNRVSAMFSTGYILPYTIIFFIIIISAIISIISFFYYRSKPNQKVDLGQDGIPFQQHNYYHLLQSYQVNRTLALKKKQLQKIQLREKKYTKPAKEQEQNILSEEVQTNNRLMSEDLQSSSSKGQSLAERISLMSTRKLLMMKNSKNREAQNKVVLNGMTLYEWNEEWIHFDQNAKYDYKLQSLKGKQAAIIKLKTKQKSQMPVSQKSLSKSENEQFDGRI